MIIQIALGIVLAVLILMFLPQILALGFVVSGIALTLAAIAGLFYLGKTYPDNMMAIGGFILFFISIVCWPYLEKLVDKKLSIINVSIFAGIVGVIIYLAINDILVAIGTISVVMIIALLLKFLEILSLFANKKLSSLTRKNNLEKL